MIKNKLTGNDESPTSTLESVVERLIDRLENINFNINNRELISLCDSYVGTLKSFDPHIYHEIAETVLNLLIKRYYRESAEAENISSPQKFVTEILKPLAARFPTQTWRSRDQTLRQQFSTPPAIAFLLSYLVNNQDDELLLEPSAGTGSLLVWSKNQIFANEIDPRRLEMLRILGVSATAFNAEFIDDYLPPEIRPDCLLMNPPFSSNGGRTANNSSKFGFRHVESALERLKKGGKFGIILGNSAGLDARTGENFWQKLSDRIQIKAIIKIAGREYAKNGTSVDVNLLTGTKYQTEQKNDWKWAKNAITSISVSSVEEGFDLAQKLNLRLDY